MLYLHHFHISRFQAHASRTHMTPVRMFRSKNWCRWAPILNLILIKPGHYFISQSFSQVYSWSSTHRCPTLTARTCRNSSVQRCTDQQQCLICDWIIYNSNEYWSYFCTSRFLINSANRSPTPRHSRFAEIVIKLEFTGSSTILLSSSVFTIHPRPKVSLSIYDSLLS